MVTEACTLREWQTKWRINFFTAAEMFIFGVGLTRKATAVTIVIGL